MRWQVVGIWVLLSVGCVYESSDVGFKSSDLVRMEALKREMATQEIPYKEDGHGFIFYDKKYRLKVNEIQRLLDLEQSVKYENSAQTALALSVMKELGIQARSEVRADGTWITWRPKDAAQQRSAESRINAEIHELIKRNQRR